MTIPVNPMPTENRLYSNITPFTVRDNATYLIVLESMRQYINDKLVPFINAHGLAVDEKVIELIQSWENQSNELIEKVDTAVEQIGDAAELAVIAKEAAEAARDMAEQFASDAEDIQDQAVANLVNNPESNTSAALSIFATETDLSASVSRITSIEDLTNTGRLSNAALESKFPKRVAEIYIDDFVLGDGDSAAWQRAIEFAKTTLTSVIHMPDRIMELSVPVDVRGLKNVIHKGKGRGISGFKAAPGAGRLANGIRCATGAGDAETTNLTFEDFSIYGGLVSVPNQDEMARNGRVFGNDFIATAMAFSGNMVPGEAANTKFVGLNIYRVEVISCEVLPLQVRGVSNVNVNDFYTERTLDAGWTHCDNVRLSNSTSMFSGDNGFSLSRGCTNVAVTNVNVYGCWFWGIWLAGFDNESGADGFVVSNINTEYCGSGGVALYEAPKNGSLSNLTIKNVLRGGEGTGNYGIGILIAGRNVNEWAENINISNVTTIDCARGGILIRDFSRGILVDGTMHIRPGSQVDEAGNVISGVDPYQNFGVAVTGEAAEIDEFERIVLSNNVGIDDRSVPYMNFGVNARGTIISKVTTHGNKSYGARSTFIDYQETASFAGLTVGRAAETASAVATINGASGSTRAVLFQQSSTNRFRIGVLGQGSQMTITGYDDSNVTTNYMTISRTDKKVSIGAPLVFASYATSQLPSSAIAGNGAVVLDTTRGKLIRSNGSSWVNLDGSSL